MKPKELQQLHQIYDNVWNKPPKDMFYKSVSLDGKLYKITKGDKIVSSVIVKDKGNVVEICNVVTSSEFRGKGYSTRLIKRIIKEYKNKVLIIWSRIPEYFNRFGFVIVHKEKGKCFMVRYNGYNYF